MLYNLHKLMELWANEILCYWLPLKYLLLSHSFQKLLACKSDMIDAESTFPTWCFPPSPSKVPLCGSINKEVITCKHESQAFLLWNKIHKKQQRSMEGKCVGDLLLLPSDAAENFRKNLSPKISERIYCQSKKSHPGNSLIFFRGMNPR